MHYNADRRRCMWKRDERRTCLWRGFISFIYTPLSLHSSSPIIYPSILRYSSAAGGIPNNAPAPHASIGIDAHSRQASLILRNPLALPLGSPARNGRGSLRSRLSFGASARIPVLSQFSRTTSGESISSTAWTAPDSSACIAARRSARDNGPCHYRHHRYQI